MQPTTPPAAEDHRRNRWWAVIGVLGRHPRLWPTALRQSRRLAASGWWRRPPFLPVPSGEYLRFRAQTQYGDPEHLPEPQDVVDYLRWCRRWDRLVGG